MSEWKKLLQKQEQERGDFLRGMAKLGVSRAAGARMLTMTPTGLSHLLEKHGVEWERHDTKERLTQILNDKVNNQRIGVDKYKECAAAGMTKAETSNHLRVTYNAVVQMEQRYEIKFADGRARNRPNQGKGIS